jgi:hypothetical protein
MTLKTVFNGSAAIGNAGIKKHFKSDEAWQPLFELVWNGFDASATIVSVTVDENGMHGLEKITVLDDGIGIEFDTLQETFGRFNDSAKKGNFSQKGEHGRGRLAFHRLCRDASWFTRAKSVDAVIRVAEPTIKDFVGELLEQGEQKEVLLEQGQGTQVELTHFTDALPPIEELREKFAIEFGWYLAVNSQKQVMLNGMRLEVPTHEAFYEDIAVDGAVFKVQLIRWEQRPTSEKSYLYLLNSSGVPVFKVLSSLNQKPNFFTSICVNSAWADTFSREKDLFSPDAHTPSSATWKKFNAQLARMNQAVYDEFLRRRAEEVVQGYELEGYFPTYAGLDAVEREWRHQHVRLNRPEFCR